LSTLISPNEPPLLSVSEIRALESLEERVISADDQSRPPTEEWYQMLTNLMMGIHSRIALDIVNDTQWESDEGDASLHLLQASPHDGVDVSQSWFHRMSIHCGCFSFITHWLHADVGNHKITSDLSSSSSSRSSSLM
jgi:hypothetical protein